MGVLMLASSSRAIADVPFDAPDPGGSETAPVSVPPPAGKYFGFHEESYEDTRHGWSAADVATVGHGAGATVQRMNVDWWWTEPQRDHWNDDAWGHYKRMYDALLARGMRPILTIGFAPQWARDGALAQSCGSGFGCEYPPAPGMDGEWAQFVSEVARRFPQAAAIEIWNEPNLQYFWKPYPDPAHYADLVHVGYWAVKQVDPNMPVLAGSLAPTQTDERDASGAITKWPLNSFLDSAYRSYPSIKNRMNGISLHLVYQSLDFGQGSLFAKAFADARSVSQRYGDGGIPLWITESGLTTSGSIAYTQEQQADGLLRQYRRLMTMPDVKAFIIHTLMDRYEIPADDLNRGFGAIVSWQPFTPKLAYCAFAGRVDTPTPYGGCAPIHDPVDPGGGAGGGGSEDGGGSGAGGGSGNGTHSCTLDGTTGPDRLRGTSKRDVICGHGGNDFIRARRRGDIVYGGPGADRIYGNRGRDHLAGGAGRDHLVGGRGHDVVRGGPGRDHSIA
jgi:hypothetical protein